MTYCEDLRLTTREAVCEVGTLYQRLDGINSEIMSIALIGEAAGKLHDEILAEVAELKTERSEVLAELKTAEETLAELRLETTETVEAFLKGWRHRIEGGASRVKHEVLASEEDSE